MVLAILCAGIALRTGLASRRARRRGAPRGRAREAHLRFAKPAALLVLLGFLGGPVSAMWLRDWDPFHTFHSWLGLTAAVLFAATAFLGHRMEAHGAQLQDRHALLGTLAFLAAAVAAIAGFVLLP